MRITKSNDGLGLDKIDKNPRNNGGAQKATESTETKNNHESVKISDMSSRLQALEQNLKTSDAFDTKRVAEITNAIRQGNFSVNSGVVADKLIASVSELLQ